MSARLSVTPVQSLILIGSSVVLLLLTLPVWMLIRTDNLNRMKKELLKQLGQLGAMAGVILSIVSLVVWGFVFANQSENVEQE